MTYKGLNDARTFIEYGGGVSGNSEPLACGMGVCFYGEVPASELITGQQLASQIGLTAGTPQFSNEPWLHFTIDDVELYIAKKSYRYNISWDHINAVGCVYGTKTVNINGNTYKVRLPKGSNISSLPNLNTNQNDQLTHNSEWNRLIYSVYNGYNVKVVKPHTDFSSLPFGTLANYSDSDLISDITVATYGISTHCSEENKHNPNYSLVRSGNGPTWVDFVPKNSGHQYYGWRPVLELIE